MSETEVYLKREIDQLKRELDRLKTNIPEVGGVWQDWTPAPIVFSDQSFANVVADGRYCVVGKLCSFTVAITFDLSGETGSWNRIYVPFPLTAKAVTPKFIFAGWGNNGGLMSMIGYTYLTERMLVRPHDASNWTSGTGKEIQISGNYEIA